MAKSWKELFDQLSPERQEKVLRRVEELLAEQQIERETAEEQIKHEGHNRYETSVPVYVYADGD
ncbi:MAG: hypothetical protein E4H14_14800 [Candidatus Thorarchaeota archaeon]|nr:MAG: hypothetical protein E4H14_14800 [Candidatus Thorarchaeota archaeon]